MSGRDSNFFTVLNSLDIESRESVHISQKYTTDQSQSTETFPQKLSPQRPPGLVLLEPSYVRHKFDRRDCPQPLLGLALDQQGQEHAQAQAVGRSPAMKRALPAHRRWSEHKPNENVWPSQGGYLRNRVLKKHLGP